MYSLKHRFIFGTALSLIVLSASAAQAQIYVIGTSQTVTGDHTGANGTAPGVSGDHGAAFSAPALTAVIDGNLTGGNGGNGANGGVNHGSSAGSGISTATENNITLTLNSGRTIRGGNGGSGGNGSGSAGGNAATGGAAVAITGDNSIVNSYSTLIGGNGADGGNGNGGNNAGGTGSTAGNGISLTGANTVLVLGGSVTGGNSGHGGTGVGTANNANGGTGGHGLRTTGSTTSITILSGATLQGGNGGNAGTGGSGTAATSGAGGRGINIGAALGTLTIEAGALLRAGTSGTGTNGGAGLDIDASTTTVSNAGTIEGGVGTNTGIGADIDGSITNFTNTSTGVIGTSTSTGDGFDLGSASVVTNFTNDGLIQTNTGYAVDIGSGTTITNFINNGTISTQTGRGINAATTVTNFQNRGTISAANGIALNITSSLFGVTIDNTGGTITSANNSATAATLNFGNMAGKTFTGGTVRNTVAGGNAFYSASTNASAFTLQDVTIIGNLAGGANNQIYSLTGSTSLTGDVDLGAGTNQITFNNTLSDSGGTDLKASGGTLDVTVGALGRVTLATAQAAANNIAAVTVTSGGQLTLNESFSSSGTFTNNGTITVGAGKVLSVGSMVAGGAGNTWNFGVDTSGNVGRLDSTGSAVDFTNSSVTVDTTLLGSAYLTDGAELLIADGSATAVMGSLSDTLATETSRLLNFRILQGNASDITSAGADATRVYLEVDRVAIEPLAMTTQTKSVASVIDSLGVVDDAGLTSIQTALQQSSTDAEIDDILAQIVPSSGDVVAATAQGTVGDVSSLVSDRMTGLRGAGAASDMLRNHVWVQGFARQADQDAIHGEEPYNAVTGGMSVGVDHRTEDNSKTFGIALSMGETNINMRNGTSVNDHVDTTSYVATLYGDMDLSRGFYLEGQTSYAYFDTEVSRQLLGSTVRGSYGARLWNGRAELGHEWQVPDTPMTVQPFVNASFNHFSADDYSETGVGALHVVQNDVKSLDVGAGLDVIWDIDTEQGHKIQPRLSASYSRDLLNDRARGSAGFVAAADAGTFATEGAARDDKSFHLGAGVNLYTKEAWHFMVDYDLEAREAFKAHSGFVRAGYRF